MIVALTKSTVLASKFGNPEYSPAVEILLNVMRYATTDRLTNTILKYGWLLTFRRAFILHKLAQKANMQSTRKATFNPKPGVEGGFN